MQNFVCTRNERFKLYKNIDRIWFSVNLRLKSNSHDSIYLTILKIIISMVKYI